jgi:hypothetical protein
MHALHTCMHVTACASHARNRTTSVAAPPPPLPPPPPRPHAPARQAPACHLTLASCLGWRGAHAGRGLHRLCVVARAQGRAGVAQRQHASPPELRSAAPAAATCAHRTCSCGRPDSARHGRSRARDGLHAAQCVPTSRPHGQLSNAHCRSVCACVPHMHAHTLTRAHTHARAPVPRRRQRWRPAPLGGPRCAAPAAARPRSRATGRCA